MIKVSKSLTVVHIQHYGLQSYLGAMMWARCLVRPVVRMPIQGYDKLPPVYMILDGILHLGRF